MSWGSKENQQILATKELASRYRESRTLSNANALLEASLRTHPDSYMQRATKHVTMSSETIRMIVADEIADDVFHSTDRDVTESRQPIQYGDEKTAEIKPVRSKLPIISWFTKGRN